MFYYIPKNRLFIISKISKIFFIERYIWSGGGCRSSYNLCNSYWFDYSNDFKVPHKISAIILINAKYSDNIRILSKFVDFYRSLLKIVARLISDKVSL